MVKKVFLLVLSIIISSLLITSTVSADTYLNWNKTITSSSKYKGQHHSDDGKFTVRTRTSSVKNYNKYKPTPMRVTVSKKGWFGIGVVVKEETYSKAGSYSFSVNSTANEFYTLSVDVHPYYAGQVPVRFAASGYIID